MPVLFTEYDAFQAMNITLAVSLVCAIALGGLFLLIKKGSFVVHKAPVRGVMRPVKETIKIKVGAEDYPVKQIRVSKARKTTCPL